MTAPAPSNFAERAEILTSRGIPVVPVVPGEKRCLLPNWQNLATIDPEQIQVWNRQASTYNTGAVCYSDGICVLDADSPELLKMLPLGVPDTFTVLSGGRKLPHLYFKQTEASRALGNCKVKGLFDFQQDRKYVVGPVSVLANGGTYDIAKDVPIVEIPDSLCDWIAAAVEKTFSGAVPSGEHNAVSALALSEPAAIAKNALRYVYGGDPERMLADDLFKLDIGPGGRHPFLTSMAAFLHNGKRGEEELCAILFRFRDRYCAKAGEKDDKEVRNIVRWVLTDCEPYIIKLPSESIPSLDDALAQFNSRYCYVNANHAIVQLSNRMVMRASDFKGAHAANRFAIKTITHANGTTTATRVSIAKEWLEWPERRQVERMVYEPGRPEFFDNQLNRWRGWGCKSIEGNTTQWEQLLDAVFRGNAEARRWFEQWCAYPIQNPGKKMAHAVILWGAKQGTGKTTIGETLGRIYGTNFSVIREEQLHASFNDWAADKQFILADEITGTGDKRTHSDRLKLMVTGSTVHVNKKFEPEYTLRDSINYLFTSNHCDSFYLEESDRRYFVWEVNGTTPGGDFFNEYYRWLDSGGPSALFHRLQHLDLSDFQPHQAPPKTAAKEEMIELGRSELDRWIQQQIADPSRLIEKSGHVWRCADLLTEYERATCPRRKELHL
jgi:hypothetical protein